MEGIHMKTKINDAIKHVLQQFGEKYFIEDVVHKSKIIQDLDGYDAPLLEAFISNETIKKNFTIDIVGNIVMQTNKLIELFEADEYWQDSYTKYSKKIGLTAGGKFIDESTDVVLDFPYKDTVLKASMSKEDTDKDDLRPDEPFLNEVIAKEEIDVLLDKKTLMNAKKYDENGVQEIDSISEDDNLIMKGNNLLALHTLKEKYAGKVKMIYIDPPYNTGNDSFKYNDRFNRSTWLTFMKNRLEIAKDLLRNDGVIFIQIDKNEEAYLKVLMDIIMGEECFVTGVTVQSSTASGNKTAHRDKTIIKTKDTILVYRKSDLLTINPQYLVQEKWDTHFNSILIKDKDQFQVESLKNYLVRNHIIDKSFTIDQGALNNKAFSEFIFDNRDLIFTTKSSIPAHIKKDSLQKKDVVISYKSSNNEEHFALNGRRLGFLSNNIKQVDGEEAIAKLLTDIWVDIDFNNTQNEGGISFPAGKKPERLLKRIISLVTKKNDLVLDFFLGSATTAAVAHKVQRRYIGIEQMEYINTISVNRLQKVIEGEQSGISKLNDVGWQGGGSFVYVELMEKNRGFLKSIQNAETQTELHEVFEFMLDEAEIDFRVDLETVKDTLHELSLDDQKKTLIKIIDKNQLYYNYSEIDDENVRDLIADNDYSFNKSFYEGAE